MRLRRARRHPRESFSQVIGRGHWEDEGPTASSWLNAFGEAPNVADSVLDELETAQEKDRAPEDKWSW